MAKTHANLWPSVVSWKNLLLAYRKCRRRKRYKPEAVRFDFQWEANLLRLRRELTDGTYTPGEYRHFYVYEPKKRKISAAPFRDRVVHHAVVNILEPIYERRFIFDSYACRRYKGTHRALRRAEQFHRRYAYSLKTDIVRFFPNVDHQILLEAIQRQIRDRQLLELVQQIVVSGEGVLSDEATPAYFSGDDLFAVLRPTGLPIGNLTSQFFANVLLDRIDHFVKEELRVPGYIRYADDLLLFDDSKPRLWAARAGLTAALAELRLRLHPDKTQLRPNRCSLKFLGFVLAPGGRRLQQSSLVRFNRRIHRQRQLLKAGALRPHDVRRSLQAWLAHARQANSVGIRRDLWKRLRF